MFSRALALGVLAFSSAAYAPPGPKQPTGKWIVDFDDATCIASREYGTETDPIYLVLKAPPTGDVLQIAVSWKGSVREPTQLDGEVAFDAYPPIRTNLLEFDVEKLGQRALIVNLASVDVSPMRKSSSIRFRARGGTAKPGSRIEFGPVRTDIAFALTQTADVLKLLDECTDNLRNVWSIWADDRYSARLKQGPVGNIAGLFNSSDYPAIAALKDQAGTVALVVLVDENGNVADCTVAQTSGAASLDAQSCAVIKERGKFKPAIGLDGKPAKSAFVQRITWRLQN